MNTESPPSSHGKKIARVGLYDNEENAFRHSTSHAQFITAKVAHLAAHHPLLFIAATTWVGKASKCLPATFASTAHKNGLSWWTMSAPTQGNDHLPATYVPLDSLRRAAWFDMCAHTQEKSLTSAVSAVLPSTEATREIDMSTAILIRDLTSHVLFNAEKKCTSSRSLPIHYQMWVV